MPSLLIGDLGTPELLIILVILGMIFLGVFVVVVVVSRGHVRKSDTPDGQSLDSDH